MVTDGKTKNGIGDNTLTFELWKKFQFLILLAVKLSS
jgi:hypothetical protein